METEISNEIRKKIYQTLYLIRFSEEKIIELYHENDMKTPMHMSMGSEAISTGICQALDKQDQVFGTYRSHALYLAKTDDVDDFFAEMYGKSIAFLKGRGGSMHMCAPSHGFMGTSAIVGSIIPVAVGAAFANKILKNNKVVVVFFGDGAVNEGCFWESLNIACLMNLPIIFVCEDNNYAVHIKKRLREGFLDIENIIESFKCRSFFTESTDTDHIYEIMLASKKLVKDNPVFIYCKYYRYLEHVGINKDFNKGYRTEEEFLNWERIDPIKIYRDKILEEDVLLIEKSIQKRVLNSIEKAKNALPTLKEEAYFGVYS